VSVGAWPNAWFPNLPGSGTAQPPACRAQKFSARSTRHTRALTHGTAQRHRPRPRRKVLRSLTRADLGAIRRICFRTHVCVCLDGRFARPEQANGPTGRGRRMKRRDRFAPQNRPERNPAERPGRDVLARRANRDAARNAAVRPHGRMRDGPKGRSPPRHAKPGSTVFGRRSISVDDQRVTSGSRTPRSIRHARRAACHRRRAGHPSPCQASQ